MLELSSYQLELTEHLGCTVAVILNVSPDHLERHGGMAGYVRAKRRILRNQSASDCAVIGVDDDHGRDLCRELVAEGGRRVVPIAAYRRLDRGVSVEDGRLIDALDGPGRAVIDLRDVDTLKGPHNWQNAAAAYAAVRVLGLDPEAAVAGMPSFHGLSHRMEPVATVDGIQFVNDSKATNADAAARSLSAFANVYWIAGGRVKEGGFDALLPWLDRVRHAYLIGEAAGAIAATLDGRVPCTECGDLATAFHQAFAAAGAERAPDPVILLAPACASFDQFRDFEERGEVFKALVAPLVAGGARNPGTARAAS